MKKLLALILLIASPAVAQTLPATQPTTVPAPLNPATKTADLESPKEQKHLLSLDGSIDITNEFIFRGYKQQSGGVITQPNLTLSFNIPQLQSEALSITPYIGSWNSTSTKSAAPHSPKWFFETDTFVGAKVESGNWTLDMYYQYNDYPGGAWHSNNEVDAVLSYDDSWYTKDKLNLPFAINPHVAFAQEFSRSDNIENGTGGTYAEFGIAPAIDVPVLGTTVTLSMPTNVGFSIANYYLDRQGRNECFGYVSTGLKAELPLDFLSGKGYGDWKLVGSATYTRMNAESTIQANDGKHDGIVGMLSLQFSY